MLPRLFVRCWNLPHPASQQQVDCPVQVLVRQLAADGNSMAGKSVAGIPLGWMHSHEAEGENRRSVTLLPTLEVDHSEYIDQAAKFLKLEYSYIGP